MREIEMKRVGNKEKEEEGGGRARKHQSVVNC